MIAKIRNLSSLFSPVAQTRYRKLLVSGASNTYNNSDKDICTWPYYLRDLCLFEEVFDCSQAGSGCNHTFNSVINEIETNKSIDPETTLVICLWPDLSRTDVINLISTVKDWHSMSLYKFNDQFGSFTLVPDGSGRGGILAKMSIAYKKVVDMDAQVYESGIKIIALDSYLKQRGFQKIFLTDSACPAQIKSLPLPLNDQIQLTIDPVTILENFARANRWIEHGHPTPDAHLTWARQYLVPYLLAQGFADKI